MRILALSDTHFGYEYGRTSQTKKEQIDRAFEVFSSVLETAKQKQVNLVLHGGDMFNRSKPKKGLVSKAYNIIEDFAKNEIDFIAIPGNHDRSHLPETLLNHISKRIHFMNKFTEVQFDDVSIIGFPFESRNPQSVFEKAREKLLNNPKTKYIVLCHQLFDGASFGPHNHIFTNRQDTLRTSNFPDNLLATLSGHIHRSQQIQNKKVQYTGSLIRTSFMEIIESKGFIFIDIEDNHFDVKFQEIQSLPMRVMEIDISNTEVISSKLEEMDINPDEKTLLRFMGRPLEGKEIKYLWARFSANDYPLLKFSPRYPNLSLRPLYNKN
ncbi:MAG: metallophosphoesterase family protein [Candidatus Heimdallarchaeaceae archaeon]